MNQARPRASTTYRSARAERARLKRALLGTAREASELERRAPRAGTCDHCREPYAAGEMVLYLTPPPRSRDAWRVLHERCRPPHAEAA